MFQLFPFSGDNLECFSSYFFENQNHFVDSLGGGGAGPLNVPRVTGFHLRVRLRSQVMRNLKQNESIWNKLSTTKCDLKNDLK